MASTVTPARTARRCRRSALGLVGIRLDLDVRADRIGVVLQIGGILDDVLLAFLLNALHLDVGFLHAPRRDRLLGAPLLHHIAPGAARTRLLDRLLGGAFRADRRNLGQVVEAGAAGDADTLGAEFRLRHPIGLAWVGGAGSRRSR